MNILTQNRARGWIACLMTLAVAVLATFGSSVVGANRADAAYRGAGIGTPHGVFGARKARVQAAAKRAKRRTKVAARRKNYKKTYKRRTPKKSYKKKSYGKSGKAAKKYSKPSKGSATKAAKSYKARKKNTKTVESKKSQATQVAALGPATLPKKKKSLTGGKVRWVANAGCLNGTLKSIVYQVASKFGPVTVSSTCRSKKRNRRVGGAKRSWHLTGNAVDFRVHSNHRAAYAYLKSHGSIGGYKHYGGGLFHIDVGPRRTW